jgi:hypothetical protein
VIEGLSGLEREYAAVDAYAGNLAKVGNFGYVCKALVLNPEIDKTDYHLVYATRNSTGVEVFKKAESKAMKEMNLARAEVNQQKREEKTGQKDLFDATTLQPTGHYDGCVSFLRRKHKQKFGS